MKVLRENDLEFYFESAVEAIVFDDNELHKGNSIKRVDFIVEFNDRFDFIEVKDPDIPSAANPAAFKDKLMNGNLIPDLASKFRDTVWFRTHSEKVNKPIHYVVLISMESLEPALILSRLDHLKSCLPIRHNDWPEPSVRSCVILNLEQYKKRYGQDSVRRLSTGA